MNQTSATKEQRLSARIRPEVHEAISQAAELSGKTVTQFVIDAALERADEVRERSTRIRLSMKGAKQMLEALENPPKASERMKAAARRYRKRTSHAVQAREDQQES